MSYNYNEKWFIVSKKKNVFNTYSDITNKKKKKYGFHH